MADIQIVMEVLGNEGIISATKSTVKLENTIKSLSKSLDAGRISDQQFNTALKELRRTLDNNGKSWQANKSYIDRYIASLRQAEQAAEQDRIAQERLNQARQRAATVLALQQQRLREEAAAQKAAEATRKSATKSYNQLLASINPTIAAQQRMKQAHDTVRAALAAGIITRQQAAQSLRDYRAAAQIAAAQSQQTARRTNQLGVVFQQTGYQVGDFAVQVQSGTNVMVALGQQATQLIGTFAMLSRTTRMIAIFSGLGIIVPIVTAFAAAWMRSKEALDAAEKSAKGLDDRIKTLTNSLKAFQRAQQSLSSGLSEDFILATEGLDDAVLEVIQAETVLQQVRERIAKPGFGFRDMLPFLGLYLDNKDLKNADAILQAAIEKRDAAVKTLNDVRTKERIENEQKVAKATKDYILDMAEVFRDAQQRIREENGKTLREIEAGFKAVAASQTTVNSETEAYIAKMSSVFKNSQNLRKELGDAAFEALRIGGVDLEKPITLAAIAASKLADNLKVALAQQLGLVESIKYGMMEGSAGAQAMRKYAGRGTTSTKEPISGETGKSIFRKDSEVSDMEAYITKMSRLFRNAQQRIREENGKTLREIDDGFKAVAASQTTLNSETSAYITKMAEAFNTSQDLRKELSDAAFEALRLSGVDITSGVSEAAKAAARLAANLGVSLSAAQSIMNLQSSKEYSGRGGDPRKVGTSNYTSELGYKSVDQLIAEFNKKNRSGGGGKSPADQLEEYMKKQENLVQLQQRQIGLSEEQARIEDLKNRYVLAGIEPNMQRIQALVAEEEQLRKTTEAEQRRKSMMDAIEGHITNAFMTMIDGSSSVENAFKSMLRNILLDIYRQQVAEPAAKGIMGVVKKVFGFADGGAFSSGRVIPFANGGVVTGPTTFPMPGATGLMGEAGPEAIMPLKRGPNGKLGVEASGGQQVVVNQSFNFAANGDESVKKIIAQAAPQIAQMTQKQIMDSRRRGGQMKSVFS